jgi:hypothetical protein
MRVRTLLCAALVGALGCADGGTFDPLVQEEARPIVVEGGLVYTGRAATDRGGVLSLDLAGDEPRAVRHPLPEGTVLGSARGTSAPSEVVLLTSGRDAAEVKGRHVEMVPSHALVLNRVTRTKDLPLSGRYQALAVSDDGRFAVAHAPVGSVVLQNAIEVVDLDPATPVSTVVRLQLDGRAPERFVFSPKDGFSRRVVAIPFPGSIVLLDLEHPERGEISVPLSVPGDTRAVTPQRILFAGDRMFVQSSGSSQVLVLELLAAPETPHGFRVIPSLLTARGNVVDIALTGSGDALRLLILAPELEVFDVQRGLSTSMSGSGFAALLPFEGASPTDTTVAPRVLLYGGQTRVGFADLGDSGGFGGAAVELVELGTPPSSIRRLATKKLALALHGPTSSQVSVIDLERRRVDPYRLSAALVDYVLDERADHAWLWILTSAGKLVRIDLLDRTVAELPVQLEGVASRHTEQVVTMGGDIMQLVSGARPRLAIQHAAAAGQVTLVDAVADATRDSVHELVGFFLAGLFD